MVTKLLAAAASVSILLIALIGAADARAGMVERMNYVSAGEYRTLATIWNASAAAQFRCPAGAKIRVRYGAGWLSKNRQQQTLDCNTAKRLSIGSSWSKFGARMQIKVPESGYVTWWYITEGP
jgi:hypothetical protein